uniref:Uncharacterized protein n=1 Tax=Spongospora subterranea TaxID=70186 RepID=A0A0H5QG93_9EUKA|eukprot:CRZ01078.1 hypothetical protein [Spongospora subterranea]
MIKLDLHDISSWSLIPCFPLNAGSHFHSNNFEYDDISSTTFHHLRSLWIFASPEKRVRSRKHGELIHKMQQQRTTAANLPKQSDPKLIVSRFNCKSLTQNRHCDALQLSFRSGNCQRQKPSATDVTGNIKPEMQRHSSTVG